jgi:hypothetical protein
MEAEEYVSLSIGEVHKKKEIVQVGAMVAFFLEEIILLRKMLNP